MSFYSSRHVEREILSALIDGELDAEQRRMVHEHLQECNACADTLAEFSQIHGMVGELPRLVAPASFVADALKPARRPMPRAAAVAFSGRRGWAALATAVVAIAITLAGLISPPKASEVPVDAFVERHVGVHGGAESGANVLIAVNGR